jgi:SAM-dependent methyltransferase
MKKCLSCQEKFQIPDWKCPYCGFSPEARGQFTLFAPELSLKNDGFNEDDFDLLNQSEDGHFWFQARNQLILWALRKYFPNAKSFFEIGCGNGFVLSGIEKKNQRMKIYGSEIYETALLNAEKRLKNVRLFQMDARKIPFVEEFDVVGAFDVLEHIKEDETVLAQMYQVVHPDGGILLSVPQHKFLWSDSDKFSFHVRRYEASELIEKVEKAGFQIILCTSFVSLLLPFMLLSRWLSKGKIKETGPKVELKINPILNVLFSKVMSVERLFIKWGLRSPWGGSLLIAARKV